MGNGHRALGSGSRLSPLKVPDDRGRRAVSGGKREIEKPLDFDFVRLEQEAFCVLTDSGTVQEETCIFGVPNVTIRDVTATSDSAEVRYETGVASLIFTAGHRSTAKSQVDILRSAGIV